MKRLAEIGFRQVGIWELDGENIRLRLDHKANTRNVLYAFSVGGVLRYIGKTTQPLKKRMYFYQNPGKAQSTNIKNNAHILAALKNGHTVEVHALADDGSLHRGGFHLNIAAGLEDSLINNLRPDWNHGGTQTTPKPSMGPEPAKEWNEMETSSTSRAFTVRIGKAYYEGGFFNVGVNDSDYFGPDGAEISVRLGKNGRVISGTINRRANSNYTPRIMCGTDYRDWVQRNYNMGESFTVEIHSPVNVTLY